MLRKLTEGIARKTTRRRFFGRGAEIAFGALAGAAAGAALRPGGALADHTLQHTTCAFPGPPCPCMGCQSNGVCAKPCIVYTFYYTTGCWVDVHRQSGEDVTCCDCNCQGFGGIGICGCGSDHHNHPDNCPKGTASS